VLKLKFLPIKNGDRWGAILWHTDWTNGMDLLVDIDPSNYVSFRMGVTCFNEIQHNELKWMFPN
jgi:hypothetical protein